MRYPVVLTSALLLGALGCAGEMGGIGSPEKEAKAGGGNPFKDVRFFLNPAYTASVKATAAKHPEEAGTIRKVATYPTGVWLSDIKAVENLKGWLDEAKQQQDASGVPTMSVIVVYNLPNRDCAAVSSAGELKVEENGEARYRTEFIDPIAAQLKAHTNQPIAVILEPDSLGNLATNMSLPKCQQSKSVVQERYRLRHQELPLAQCQRLSRRRRTRVGWAGTTTAPRSPRCSRPCSTRPAARR